VSRIDDLERWIAPLRDVVVALSGGVDSSVVAAVAARVLGDRALAVTADSPALAAGELVGARCVAAAAGIRHQVIATNELARAGYRGNARDRCYHCKTELYESLARIAARSGETTILSGANADDLADWRPGLRAASEHGVRHPLLELGIGKQEVRELARALGVLSAEKPASPCLASRIPYGTEVDPAALARIDRAEHALKLLGYPVIRVRHYGDRAGVEIGEEDLPRALAAGRSAVIEAVRRAGYRSVRVSEKPFRSGSLNAIRPA
jgi:pyridinium-3,5-biscarboxylic acid mononucleotide sulfurtransferase